MEYDVQSNTISMSLLSLLVFNQATCAIYYHYAGSKHTKQLQKDAKLIADRAKALRSRVGERDKLQCEYGVWYVTRPEEEMGFAACVDGEFPERVAFGLIAKSHETIVENAQNTMERKISKVKKGLDELCWRYKDGGPDKVQEAIRETELLKNDLKKSVKKIIDNGQQLQVMSQKSFRLQNYAKQFQKSADTVQKKLFWTKWKRVMIVGGIVAGSFAAIGFLFYLGAA